LYLLITRVRDEEKYLPDLFKSVFAQTIKPNLWVIVDHESKDDSAAIIDEAAGGKSWIKIVHLEATEEYGLFCHARPLKVGFEVAVNHAAENDIPYNYLGILDADIVAEPAYFEKLIKYLESNSGLGITGGQLYIIKNDVERPEGEATSPRGGCRLYRRECFENIGGTMPESAIWDTETDVLSEIRGWQISILTEAKAVHKRATFSRKGILRGYSRRGACHYYANYHPVSALLISLLFTCKPPFLIGLFFLSGYIKSWIQKIQQSPNPEIRDYFWKSFYRLKRKMAVKIADLIRRRV